MASGFLTHSNRFIRASLKLVLCTGTIGGGSVSRESSPNSFLLTRELPSDTSPEFTLGGVAGLALFGSPDSPASWTSSITLDPVHPRLCAEVCSPGLKLPSCPKKSTVDHRDGEWVWVYVGCHTVAEGHVIHHAQCRPPLVGSHHSSWLLGRAEWWLESCVLTPGTGPHHSVSPSVAVLAPPGSTTYNLGT